MNTAPIIRTSPNFDGTIGTTSTEPNPELGYMIKTAVAKELLNAAPSATNIKVELVTDLEGVHPTSERSIYNHFGFVQVEASATTRAGNTITLDANFDTNMGKLMFVMSIYFSSGQ